MHKKPNISTAATFSETGQTPTSSQDWTAPSGAPADSDLLLPGSLAGEYVIDALIGRGGMGAVYAARQPVIGKRVAVKVLSARLRDAQAAVRFVREARAVNTIGHPNIVDIFAFGTLPDGRQYYVMELLRGQSLRDRLHAGPLTAAEIERCFTQLCAALQSAHDVGIVHRDLKPENIWLARTAQTESLKLLDFGIAKFFDHDPGREALTASGTALGTPAYMSPEQCSGAAIDARTDVYALGIILFEIYMGRLPFEGDAIQLLAQHLTATPPLATHAPGAVAALIADCLAKDPKQRPQEAAELSERMSRAAGWRLGALATLPSQPVLEQDLANPRGPRLSHWRKRILVALVVAAVGVGLAQRAWTRLSQTSSPRPQLVLPTAAANATLEPAIPTDTAQTTSVAPLAPATPSPSEELPAGEALPPRAAKLQRPDDAVRPSSNAERRGLALENPFR